MPKVLPYKQYTHFMEKKKTDYKSGQRYQEAFLKVYPPDKSIIRRRDIKSLDQENPTRQNRKLPPDCKSDNSYKSGDTGYPLAGRIALTVVYGSTILYHE